MSELDPKKMKVAELRDELKARGLDTKGNKPVLVKRLTQAIAEASGIPHEEDDSVLDTSQNDTLDTSQEESVCEEQEKEATDASEVNLPSADIDDNMEDESVGKTVLEEDHAVQEESKKPDASDAAPEAQAEGQVQSEDVNMTPAEEQNKPTLDEQSKESDALDDEANMKDEEKSDQDAQTVDKDEEMTEDKPCKAVEENVADSGAVVDDLDDDLLPGDFKVLDSVGDEPESDQKMDEAGRRDCDRRSRKRHHDDRYRSRSHSPEPIPEVEENEDWLQATHLLLDKYNSDLNLRISDDGYKANPITVEGFGFMWAGARANYGVSKGKVCFEVKVVDELRVEHLPEEETSRHVVRVGFSVDSASTQLGEEPFSYGYGGTGKSSVDCKFTDFGKHFGKDDVVTAYLDYSEETVIISYSKNGEDLGTCFEVEAATLEGKALFPHILSKNCEVAINFGQQEEAFFPVKEGFAFINDVPEAERVRGSLPPEKKEDCEMIMMCGLPGAGKTYWATKESLRNPEKKYNILGTNHIIDKMKVMGLPRKRNYRGRWDVLIDKSTKCLNRLFEIAAKKKRNYILDQTNVYPSAQRRKMRPFEGFQRKAVVLVPNDEEFKKRCAQREKEEGKEVPDSAVLEMKANFALPVEGNLFDKVEYVELDKEEADKVVQAYNKEGRNAIPPPDKRMRGDRYGDRSYGDRDRYGSSGGYRDDRYSSRSYGGYNGGGYRDNRRGYDKYRDSRSSYNSSSRDRRGSYMGYSDRDRQRASGYTDRRDLSRDYRSSGSRSYGNSSWSSSGQSGSWGGHQGSWGNSQGSWGSSGQSGSWGGQGWGNQWSGYGSSQQGQSWGSNSGSSSAGYGSSSSYGSNYNSGSWSGYNQGQSGSGSWSGYSSGSSGYHHK